MRPQLLAAVDFGGLAICLAVGAFLAIESYMMVAIGLMIAALAFGLSGLFQLQPTQYDEFGEGVLKALVFASSLVILLGIAARTIA